MGVGIFSLDILVMDKFFDFVERGVDVRLA